MKLESHDNPATSTGTLSPINYLNRIIFYILQFALIILHVVWIKIRRPSSLSFSLLSSPPPTPPMSIALERNNSATDQSIERPGFVRRNMACAASIYNSPDFSLATDRRVSPVEEEEEDRSASMSSSSTSSIGKNSDEESSGGEREGEEVHSEYKEGALDSLDDLEEVLPVKKSISKFYSGKSKSFTSLSDAASCSSMKDITKPENAYSRKRKNLMAYKNFWERNSNNLRNSPGGITKRPNNSRSMLALAAISNCGESSNCETSNSTSSPPGCRLPPLPPNARRTICSELSSSPPADKFSSWRSFSLSDLQGAAADASSPGIPGYGSNK